MATDVTGALARTASTSLSNQQFEQNAVDFAHKQEERSKDMTNRGAVDESLAAAGQTPGAPDDDVHSAVEGLAQHLHDGTLDDNHVPNNQQGISPTGGAAPPAPGSALPGTPPAPSPVAGAPPAAVAAADPAAQQGVPQKSAAQSGKPHSLSPDYWDNVHASVLRVARTAALAGKDPKQAYDAAMGVVTSHFQGQIMKNLSAANIALQAHNPAAVEQAIKNVYYYFPDGKDLTVQKDDQGNLVYQDPVNPYVDSKGNLTTHSGEGTKPNMVPVDAQHLHMLAVAATDPSKVYDAINGARSAQAKQEQEAMDAGSRRITAGAAATTAQAAKTRAPAQAFKDFAVGNYNTAHGQYFLAKASELALKANNAGGMKPADALKGATQVATYLSQLAQGVNTTAPVTQPVLDKQGNPRIGPDGKPMMTVSDSPVAGKTYRDPAKIHPYLVGAGADKLAVITTMGTNIFTANGGRISPQQATELAIAVHKGGGKGNTHEEGGKQVPNAKQKGSTHYVWNDATKSWTEFSMDPNIANTATAEFSAKGSSTAPEDDESEEP